MTDNPLSPDNLPVSDTPVSNPCTELDRPNSGLSDSSPSQETRFIPTPEKQHPESPGYKSGVGMERVEGVTPTPTDPPTPLNDEKSSPGEEAVSSSNLRPPSQMKEGTKVSYAYYTISLLVSCIVNFIKLCKYSKTIHHWFKP